MNQLKMDEASVLGCNLVEDRLVLPDQVTCRWILRRPCDDALVSYVHSTR